MQNQLLLEPNDVLFFKDGRPMEGSLSGSGAAWPMPNVVDAALHAALHRSDIEGHAHGVVNGKGEKNHDNRAKKFGSLVSVGPFPCKMTTDGGDGIWWFPRPRDAQKEGTHLVTHFPRKRQTGHTNVASWMPCVVTSGQAPDKDNDPENWISKTAYEAYLRGGDSSDSDFLRDNDFMSTEKTFGIGLSDGTDAVESGKFYSASYLRLKEGMRLGVIAKTQEKVDEPDLIKTLFPSAGNGIVIGGQQRVCSAVRQDVEVMNLPLGLSEGFESEGKFHLKWILLTPAIWPAIPAESKTGKAMNPHHGGWLPNWIDQNDGKVLLKPRKKDRKRSGQRGAVTKEGNRIDARLVAATVPKPLPVTGWGISGPNGPGAKPTHLAVPAGAVYYFESDSEEQINLLARALNWHGETKGTDIVNRRSTLMGEKGFGIGVCGTWRPYHLKSKTK